MLIEPKNTWQNFLKSSELWEEIIAQEKQKNFCYINPCSGVFILESNVSENSVYFEYDEQEKIKKAEVHYSPKEDKAFSSFLSQLKKDYELE